MEFDNPELPPLKAMMMHCSEGKGMTRWMVFYYAIPMWVFLLITVVATWLLTGVGDECGSICWLESFILLLLLCLLQFSAALWVQRKKSATGVQTLSSVYGEESSFTKLFEGTDEAGKLIADFIAVRNDEQCMKENS